MHRLLRFAFFICFAATLTGQVSAKIVVLGELRGHGQINSHIGFLPPGTSFRVQWDYSCPSDPKRGLTLTLVRTPGRDSPNVSSRFIAHGLTGTGSHSAKYATQPGRYRV